MQSLPVRTAPTLAELPAPPAGKTGWPWTEATPAIGEMPNGRAWPRVTIVTPSYNQGCYLEATIRSVLLQGYPNVEYMVMDGGSTDDSVEVIRKYERWIAAWVRERDGGQPAAINKGFRRSTGEIVAWLNSDDLLWPGALAAVAKGMHDYPENGAIFGNTVYVDAEGREFERTKGFPYSKRTLLYRGRPCIIHVIFVKREAVERIGLLNETRHFAFDYDYQCRLALAGIEARPIDEYLSAFRWQAASKTVSSGMFGNYKDMAAVCLEHGGSHFSFLCREYYWFWLRLWMLNSGLGFAVNGYRAMKRLVRKVRYA